MHTIASKFGWSRWFLIATLYVSIFGCATEPVSEPEAAAPAPVTQAPVAPAAPQQPQVSAIPAAPAVAVAPVAPAEPVVPHIALLLPLKSPSFAKAAEAVQQGFLAAAEVGKTAKSLPVRVYPFSDEGSEIVAQYHKAVSTGAVAVAGPLTRNGVATLAADPNLPVPTLALNMIEGVRNDHLFFFGLPTEAEARQSAQRATAAGLLSATIVSTNTPLSKRLAQAFADEWQRSGGIIQSEIVYTGDPSALKELPTDPGNSVFLAAEADKARLIRPYINSALPVYATSQVFIGNTHTLTNYDISDVRFVDMPWMLQPDHPAVMIYPRSATPLSPDMERLYALGIDAFRILQVVSAHSETTALPLDGVTGKITLYGHTFQRESVLAMMKQGQGIPVKQ